MPIRTPRGRAAAYRALWQWPLRSPARLVLTVVAFTVVAVGVSFGVGAVSGAPSGPVPRGSPDDTATGVQPSRSRGPAVAVTPAPTALPPVRELVPSTRPLSQAPSAAVRVAARWSAAWLRPTEGTTGPQWLNGLRPYTTDEYLGVLAGVDPANIPATRVTGEPRPVRVAERSLQVEVPTDALTLVVLVVDTEAGWRVAGYDRA
ncbi:MAG: hypothetical protein ACRDRK_19590 [Pseudonocardia sp.]